MNSTTPRPKNLTLIAALLALLAVFSLTSTIVGRVGLGARPQGNFPQSGDFAPGNRIFQPEGNFQPNGSNTPGEGRPRMLSGGGGGAVGLFRLPGVGGPLLGAIGYISTAISITGILLTLLAAYGVWKQKRWALNLAIAIGLLFLIGTLPRLFGGFGPAFSLFGVANTVLNWGTALASLPIIALSALPSWLGR